MNCYKSYKDDFIFKCQFILNKLSESSDCSRTVPIVSNRHVCKAIYINGQKLKEMSNTKFLAVILDSKLDWSPYIHELNKKLRTAAALLSNIRLRIPEK